MNAKSELLAHFFCFLADSHVLAFLKNSCNSLGMGGLSHLSAQLSAVTPPVPAGDKHAQSGGS